MSRLGYAHRIDIVIQITGVYVYGLCKTTLGSTSLSQEFKNQSKSKVGKETRHVKLKIRRWDV